MRDTPPPAARLCLLERYKDTGERSLLILIYVSIYVGIYRNE